MLREYTVTHLATGNRMPVWGEVTIIDRLSLVDVKLSPEAIWHIESAIAKGGPVTIMPTGREREDAR